MKSTKEWKEAYWLAKKIVSVMEGDLAAFGQACVRVEPDGKFKRVPMRTFYIKPRKKHMTPQEHFKELRKLRR